MKRLATLGLFLLACSSLAGEIRKLRRAPRRLHAFMVLSARVYNSGKECRHATAEVTRLAGQDGLPARAPMYWVREDKTEGHTFPVIYSAGEWWAIDSVFDTRQNKYIPITRQFNSYAPKRDIREYARFTHRPLLEYIGDATPARITSWLDEETVWGLFREELRRAREKLKIGEKILQLCDKFRPGVWDHYLKATERHRQSATDAGPE